MSGTRLGPGTLYGAITQADVIRRALEVDVNGENPFRVVQATWNLLEPSSGAALAEAHSAGWDVIVKEVLANGRLTIRSADEPLRDPKASSLIPHASVLANGRHSSRLSNARTGSMS